MKKIFINSNLYIKTFFIAFFAGCFVSSVLLILGLCNLLTLFIPLGIFLGTLFSSLSYLLLGKISDSKMDDSKKTKFSIGVIYVRLLILISLMLLEVFFQLKMDIILFNPFGFLGAYFFTSIIYGIFYMGGRKCA